jgi:predicted O-methyltransferase YrrM
MKGGALIHWLRYVVGLDAAITQTSAAERELLAKAVTDAKRIVEIGIFEGVNTATFALNAPSDAKVYAIDPFFKGALGFNYGKFIAFSEWKKQGIQQKVVVVQGLSWDVHTQVPDELDFVFVDGDHSYEGVKKDFDTYATKLKSGGIIALHDARLFSNGWTRPDWGPVELVNKHIRNSHDWEIVDEIDSLVLIRKKCG